ncbi:hypothetical protein BRIN106911_21620 [Brevibacillus invocatus]
MYTYTKPHSSRVEKHSTRETEGRNSQVAQLQKLQGGRIPFINMETTIGIRK